MFAVSISGKEREWSDLSSWDLEKGNCQYLRDAVTVVCASKERTEEPRAGRIQHRAHPELCQGAPGAASCREGSGMGTKLLTYVMPEAAEG